MIQIKEEYQDISKSVKELIIAIQNFKLGNGNYPTKQIVREPRIGIAIENSNLVNHPKEKYNTILYDEELRPTPLEKEATQKIFSQNLFYDDLPTILEATKRRRILLQKKATRFLKLSKVLGTEEKRKRALDLFDKYFEDLIKIDAYIAKLHEYIESERTR